MEKKLIYKNQSNIDAMMFDIARLTNDLNANYEKVIKYNKELTPTIIIYLSFIYHYGKYNMDIYNKLYELLKVVVSESTPYWNEQLVQDYQDKLLKNMFKNDKEIIELADNLTMEEDKHNAIELAKKNLTSCTYCSIINIDNVFTYIKFDDKEKKFIPNDKAIKEYVNSNMVYTTNGKQNKVLSTLENIEKEFQELQNINTDLDFFLFNRTNCKLVYDRDLATIISSIS